MFLQCLKSNNGASHPFIQLLFFKGKLMFYKVVLFFIISLFTFVSIAENKQDDSILGDKAKKIKTITINQNTSRIVKSVTLNSQQSKVISIGTENHIRNEKIPTINMQIRRDITPTVSLRPKVGEVRENIKMDQKHIYKTISMKKIKEVKLDRPKEDYEYIDCEKIIPNRHSIFNEFYKSEKLRKSKLPVSNGPILISTHDRLTLPKDLYTCEIEIKNVCASVDTGIRCVTAPCPSMEYSNSSSSCNACANLNVYGIYNKSCIQR